MADVQFEKVTEEINGVKYTAQYYGLRQAMRAAKVYTNPETGKPDPEKLADYVFENVIVEPSGLSIESFSTFAELNPVVLFAQRVLDGNFRREENKTATKRSSGK